MKKVRLCSLLFLIIGTSGLYAQGFKKGDYIVDNNIDKFLGTWQWTDGQDTFKVILEKKKYYHEQLDIHTDLAIGWHEYAENGEVIESSIKKNASFEEATLVGSSEGERKLSLSLSDLNSKRSRKAILELLPGKSDEAILELSIKEGVYVITDATRAKEGPKIPVPVEWTMKKIE